ncbi:HemK2/MTQ2 family protein methyltransferase [Streptomyces sp. NPDC059740]|uniref:HemK2/MTQ2 family protein methyltransferase n=1 Tax=Streptomyces sp. NPDC059740 TaxID=3346926 RepID=UPI003669F720
MPLITLPGVYAPQQDSALLVAALRQEVFTTDTTVLEVGCGTGAVSLAAALHGAGRVTAVDLCRRAVASARLNARLWGVEDRVSVRRGDLADAAAGQRFDVLLANPPYVPTPPGSRTRGRARAWDAGPDGRVHVDGICSRAPDLLAPGGVLLMVHSALTGTERTLQQLDDMGMAATVTRRRTIAFGPVLRGRACWLAAQGLITEGQTTEEIVVVRAVAPRRSGQRRAPGTGRPGTATGASPDRRPASAGPLGPGAGPGPVGHTGPAGVDAPLPT